MELKGMAMHMTNPWIENGFHIHQHTRWRHGKHSQSITVRHSHDVVHAIWISMARYMCRPREACIRLHPPIPNGLPTVRWNFDMHTSKKARLKHDWDHQPISKSCTFWANRQRRLRVHPNAPAQTNTSLPQPLDNLASNGTTPHKMEAPCAKHTCVAHWMKHIMELPSPLRQRWGVDCKLGTQTTWENDSEQNPAYWIISKRKPSVTIWKVAKTMGLYVHTKIANLMWQVCPSCTKSDKAYKMQKFFIAYTMHNSMTKPKKSINSYFDLMHNNMTP